MRKPAKTFEDYWYGRRRICSYLRFIVHPWRFRSMSYTVHSES
ncbi:MAG: hypothetical protein AB1815_03965 [Bacillota bacterium]